jgi:phage shock protein A
MRATALFERFKVEKRVKEQEEALARVERRLTALEIQWSDTLDRLKTMMGRILKERGRTEAARVAMGEQEEHLSDEDVASGHNSLSQRQEQINQRILARRNRLGGGTQ